MQNIFAPWCNGSTEDFESFSLGSNPGGAAVINEWDMQALSCNKPFEGSL
jgi:hypothetical protein